MLFAKEWNLLIIVLRMHWITHACHKIKDNSFLPCIRPEQYEARLHEFCRCIQLSQVPGTKLRPTNLNPAHHFVIYAVKKKNLERLAMSVVVLFTTPKLNLMKCQCSQLCRNTYFTRLLSSLSHFCANSNMNWVLPGYPYPTVFYIFGRGTVRYPGVQEHDLKL